MTLPRIPSILRAAAIAVALGGTAFTAMPVQAQPSFEFRFGGPNWQWHFDTDRDRVHHCIGDRQVRRDLRRDGYRNIRFVDRRGRIVQVVARLGNRNYIISYDTCRQRIVDRDRIRRR